MVSTEVAQLANKVLDEENALTRLKLAYGEQSPEFQTALRDFKLSWLVLRACHNMDDFLAEVTQ